MTTVKFTGQVPRHNMALCWCWENVGTQGVRWYCHILRRQDGEHYYEFMFTDPNDATMFALRWS